QGKVESHLVEAAQRLEEQLEAQPAAALRGENTEVLDGPDPRPLAHPLYAAAEAIRPFEEPGRAGKEARLPHDRRHQRTGAIGVAETREEKGVDLAEEAAEEHVGV